MKVRIYYEDTDAGGIVYHTNYIKYCERARSEHFFSRGMMPGEGNKSGFVVRKIDADFLGSARLGDLLEVRTSVEEFKKSSLILLQEIYKEETKLFSMKVMLVYVEAGKPRRIPEKLANILLDFGE
ncbi:YbgC/FadM family acyl-CoA thioesterase [Sulfurovum mangrovi]|uniref:YbgC/FadM family acyl-CoA thioesterase n=1 Tax=Sulfurovum mangrovi TaxID=2893889 RepID=UPI001E2C23DB|nr:YbgC/FadM family acyl-CoA thioesterase [Sulfurovum mangrovi]UFH58293.1 YbgC/FadM family acyl-CoA thioesterase [Sulfurovum mangrovi]